MVARRIRKNTGFTLIELMIVMSIVALLMGMVGPLAINSLEKAQAKQEMLTLNNWLGSIKKYAFARNESYMLSFQGKKVQIFRLDEYNQHLVKEFSFNSIFFNTQQIFVNNKSFANEKSIIGTYRNKEIVIEF